MGLSLKINKSLEKEYPLSESCLITTLLWHLSVICYNFPGQHNRLRQKAQNADFPPVLSKPDHSATDNPTDKKL